MTLAEARSRYAKALRLALKAQTALEQKAVVQVAAPS